MKLCLFLHEKCTPTVKASNNKSSFHSPSWFARWFWLRVLEELKLSGPFVLFIGTLSASLHVILLLWELGFGTFGLTLRGSGYKR